MNELPKPVFSDSNPYWQPSPFKRLTGQDFAYAWTWEIHSRHQGALDYVLKFVRGPVWLMLWKHNLKNWIRLHSAELLRPIKIKPRRKLARIKGETVCR